MPTYWSPFWTNEMSAPGGSSVSMTLVLASWLSYAKVNAECMKPVVCTKPRSRSLVAAIHPLGRGGNVGRKEGTKGGGEDPPRTRLLQVAVDEEVHFVRRDRHRDSCARRGTSPLPSSLSLAPRSPLVALVEIRWCAAFDASALSLAHALTERGSSHVADEQRPSLPVTSAGGRSLGRFLPQQLSAAEKAGRRHVRY